MTKQHLSVEDELADAFNYEIARETILDKYPNTDVGTIDCIWERCDGNPWNALPLLEIIKVAEKNERTN